ncbi:D-alanine--D-alanine ligase family protein [Melioribacter sp. OK-6-Me]|uniref:D-alanine--D-alanine ligase family protein n=1 Tax=unclassified Melioribacter TaxID=2627329 RepID=UPI003ED952F1
MQNSEIKIVLLVGGVSTERKVSKASGKSIYSALKNLNYNVSLIDPAYGLTQPAEEELFFADEDVAPLSVQNYIDIVNSEAFDNIDVAFLALHGKWGEDGRIQSLLEMRNIKYTGSGVLSSSLAMNKYMAKIMFQHYDVKTPRWFIVSRKDNNVELIKKKIEKFFGLPCVVKPNDEGSTVGISICREYVSLEGAINRAFEYSDNVLIEEFIPGRELTVGIFENRALPVLEIIPRSGFYDYESKYTSGKSDYIVPANIPENVARHIQSQALLAYNSVGCRQYARVDFRMTEDFKAYCLEINTLPGMTSTSLFPKMANAIGISFEELIDRIVKSALT